MEDILEKIGDLVFIDKDKGTAKIHGFRKTFKASVEQLTKIAPYFGASVKIKYRTISANTCEIVDISPATGGYCSSHQSSFNPCPNCGTPVQTSLF